MPSTTDTSTGAGAAGNGNSGTSSGTLGPASGAGGASVTSSTGGETSSVGGITTTGVIASTTTGGTPPLSDCSDGYSTLPGPNGSVNYEKNCYDSSMLDKSVSRAAFEEHVYPLLVENCSPCHSTTTKAQAPIHSDALDPSLAHEYALTKVNFKNPATSRLVERLRIDRHNCFVDQSCADSGEQMLAAVTLWVDAVAPTLQPSVAGVATGTQVTEGEVLAWISADRATFPESDKKYIKYASFHEMQNAGLGPNELDLARVGLSKALNTAARWAPAIKNPVDISDAQGMVYRIDTRDYWGYNKGITSLPFGGSDDDLAFGTAKKDYQGNAVNFNTVFTQKLNFSAEVSEDASFADLVWGRIEAGNVEGATSNGVLPPQIDGFKPEYVEAGQLTYTLTRPDVYNAIMAIPWFGFDLEKELGIVHDNGALSYEYMLTQQAITVDSRMYYRARIQDNHGGETYYWKTWDVFTGQLPSGIDTIEAAYEQGVIRFPFWRYPIPVWVDGGSGSRNVSEFSFLATLAQRSEQGASAACEGQTNFGDPSLVNCRYFTGEGGLQQSAMEVIWGLPNGLQGYALFGALNQRRVDAFVNIVRDPRILRPEVAGQTVSDEVINSRTDFATPDVRLNTGSSCVGCHQDGMNRGSNDLRDWLDAGTLAEQVPGERGVADWIDDPAKVAEVKQYYPPSSVMRPRMEEDRRRFLAAEGQIRQGMMLSPDKNVGVEPTIASIEWTRSFYDYPVTRSN